MKQYLMYLRKSRMDTDYDEVSVAETLSRHRTTFEKPCRTKRLHVVEVLEEVVSGESLSARPKMQRLLELVGTGAYAGVICMDIERLSRGSSMESGYIMQILQVNNCQIITQKQWDWVKAAQSERYHQPTHTDGHLQNPFAGILYCERCGAGIKRKVPHKDRTCIPWYQCPARGCDAKMVKCEVLENAILEAMEDWLWEYTLQINCEEAPKVNPIETALETVRGQLAGLLQQQENICEYLEKGIYTVEMFHKRNTSLEQEIKKLQASEADLMEQLRDGDFQKKGALQIIPTTQHILDHYQHLTVEEKNRLWKLVLRRITVYRSQDDELSIHLYPNLPQ